jgi:hypothetical protein
MTDVDDMTISDLENVIIGRKAAEKRARDEAITMMSGVPAKVTEAPWTLTRNQFEKLPPLEQKRAARSARIVD